MMVLKKIIRRIIRLLEVYPFLVRNIYMSLQLHAFEKTIIDGFIYRAFKLNDYNNLEKIYSKIHGGRKLRWHLKLLYALFGSKYAVIVENDKRDKTAGFILFYFNKNDRKNNTIHGFSMGVDPLSQGFGIGTNMMKLAGQHFIQNGLAGITAKVAKKNIASLKVVEKQGFKILNKFDLASKGEEWYYLEWLFDE